MANIAPFRGLRFNTDKVSRLEDVVTPPYDVIDERAQAAFLAKNPCNMIQLDLGKTVGQSVGGSERYENAKKTLTQWLDEEILVRDQEPAIYLYHISYTHPSGKQFTRKGLVALVGLAEFSEGIVKPHEKTFSGVTSDRLQLLDTCQAQFSQIFSLYPDEKGAVISLLESAVRLNKPLCSAEDQDGNQHVVWKVTDPETLAEACALFQDKALYIADGHHRYTTALQLRQLMRERDGEVSEDSPYNHTMMYLCGMEDEGLTVLPTHRLVRIPSHAEGASAQSVPASEIVERLSPGFEVEEIKNGARETVVAEVLTRMAENDPAQSGQAAATVFGLYHPVEDRCFLLTLKDGVMENALGANQPRALQDLDVVALSDLVLDRFLGLTHEQCEQEDLIDYFSDPDEALDVAVKASTDLEKATPVLFLMNPTTVAQVKQVADEDLIMPHKSTFFYPKILTGLVMNKIAAGEKIGI